MRTFFKYIGYFIASASVVTLIATIAINGYKAKESLDTIQVNQTEQSVKYDSLTSTIQRLNGNFLMLNQDVLDIKTEQKIQGRKQDNLKALVIQEFAKTMNSGQVLDMINMLEKKNGRQIVLQE